MAACTLFAHLFVLYASIVGGSVLPDLSRRQGIGQSIGGGIQHDGTCSSSQVRLLNWAAQDMQNMALAASRFDSYDPVDSPWSFFIRKRKDAGADVRGQGLPGVVWRLRHRQNHRLGNPRCVVPITTQRS